MATHLPLGIGRPATRALEAHGITCLEDFSSITEKELAALHGVGPKAIGILHIALKEHGLSFAVGPDAVVEKIKDR